MGGVTAGTQEAAEVFLSTIETSRAMRPSRSSQNDTV